MFLSLNSTPCLAEHIASWQQVEMHPSSIVYPSLLYKKGARRAGIPQTWLPCCPLQQTSPSPNPGAEFFLADPPSTVSSSQKPSPPDSTATGSQPDSVQPSRIHGRGHPGDTSVSFSITGISAKRTQTPISLLLPPPSEDVQRQKDYWKKDFLSKYALWLYLVE